METRAEHAAKMVDYCAIGEQLAAEIGNRGPLRFDDDGALAADIVDAYSAHGYYIFEGVIDAAEIEELRLGVDDLLSRAPVAPGAEQDAAGRPAFGRDLAIDPFLFIKPLSDPWGGTTLLAGRHQTQMEQPAADADAPEYVVHLIAGVCQAIPAGLRLYGHPQLLAVAASVNGADFVPYNDVIFVKQPGLGGAVSWHQDGATHWDNPDWDDSIHGFNFQVQLHRTTSANALWVVPGTHKAGRINVKELVAQNGGDERLPGAIPLVCAAGDVTIVNRQMLHGSFVNSSPDPRLSMTFGFHRRSSVLGVEGKLAYEADGSGQADIYDAERIFTRSGVIATAIDARSQHFPAETPFRYEPLVGFEDDFRYDDDSYERVLRDYNTRDIFI
jgi:hypothetical protein